MNAFLFLLLLVAAPQDPKFESLDNREIFPVPIHTDMNTLLVFPKEVTGVFGVGLVDGSEPGLVQFQKPKNQKVIILRQMEWAQRC